MSEQQELRTNWARRGSIAAAVLLVLSSGGYGIYRLIAGSTTPQKHELEVVTLKLIQPPPPPPPPPPQVQKPPEPVKTIEPPKDMKPPDQPKAAAKPAQNLALDAKAGPGSDSFGLGGHPGGQDFIGGGGNSNGFGWYANQVSTAVLQLVNRDDELSSLVRKSGSGRHTSLKLAIWVSADGRPERVKLMSASGGNSEIEQRFEQLVGSMPKLPDAPPANMPEPIYVLYDTTG